MYALTAWRISGPQKDQPKILKYNERMTKLWVFDLTTLGLTITEHFGFKTSLRLWV